MVVSPFFQEAHFNLGTLPPISLVRFPHNLAPFLSLSPACCVVDSCGAQGHRCVKPLFVHLINHAFLVRRKTVFNLVRGFSTPDVVNMDLEKSWLAAFCVCALFKTV